MASMAPGLKGITVDTTEYRPATFIETALRNVGWAAVAGFALLILALALLASWRTALIGLITIPVALMMAAYILYLRGTTFTTITLLGLAAAVCVVIDDVVTDVDAGRRRIADQRRAEAGGTQTGSASITACFAAVRGPLVFATLAILLATLPFLVLGAAVTAFSRPLVVTYALAAGSSMVVAFLLTPILATLLLRGAGAGRQSRFAGWVMRMFDQGFAAITWRRAWAAAGVLVVAALAVIPQIGRNSLLPQLQDRNLLVHAEAASGTSLPEMERITAAAGNEVRTVPGVRSVGTHVGRAVGSDQLVDVNSAEMWITLSDGADYGQSRAAIETVLRGYPGLRSDLRTYPDDRVGRLLADASSDLIVRVYGADLTVLQDKARQVRAMLSGVPGVTKPVMHPVPQQPTVDVRVNLAAAQRYGLRPGDVRRDATTLTSGLIVGSLYEQSKIFDVVVWGAPRVRANLTELGNLRIDTPSGGQVPLKDVATLSVRPEPTAIVHNDVLRSVDVTASVTGDPSAVVSAVRSRLAQVPMPYEYHAEVVGNVTTHRADDIRSLAYGAVALVGLFLLMQACVASWRRAGLMLASLPLSITGGVLSALLAGGIWSTASLAGLFAVMALAIRASILLGRRIQVVEASAPELGDAEEQRTARQRIIRDVARERAVPVTQSALATAAILLPPAVAGTQAGLEFLHPLAVTMLGGLVSLIIVQVFLLPAFLMMTIGRTRKPAPAAPDASGRSDAAQTAAMPG
jgi:Cu/Ag efflux pump CusA